MWSHHVRLALRTLARDKGSAALGGLSLAVALAACVLIALFVREELSYDRSLPEADRISFVVSENHFAGERSTSTSTPYLLAETLLAEAPAAEAATVTYGGGRELPVLGRGDELTVKTLYADSLFFEVFQAPFLAGDAATALDAPDGAVITASTARRVFGRPAPIGESISLVGGDTLTFTVRGVVADPPELSSVSYELVASFTGWRERNPNVGTGWGSRMYQTYALRRAGTDAAALQTALGAINDTHTDGREFMRFVDVPLVDFRLSEYGYATEGFGGSATLLKVFSAVALLILVLGAINYVNLATARGARRAKEIGVRKALGSGRGALVRQFLAESVVLSALAALAGLVLAAVALPFFNETFGADLVVGDLDGPFLVGLGAGALVVGVLAGLYPALYLSGFEPLRVLRGAAAPAQAAGEAFLARTWLRRGLVVFQFAAVVALLTATGSVVRQLDYFHGYPLGLEPEGLVVVPITDPTLAQQSDVVRRAFERTPGVVAAAGASGVPPRFYMAMNMAPDPQREDLDVSYKIVDGDHRYADVVGLQMAAGRWIQDTPDDAARAFVINESFAEALGWSPEEAVGREIKAGFSDGLNVVVGVARDFHFASFRETVGPVAIGPARLDAFSMDGVNDANYPEVAVRLDPADPAASAAALRQTWVGLAGDAPFEPRFVADQFAELVDEEVRLAKTFGLFALIAVLIAALGLVGLATYTAERRTKELGIRKVLGASVGGLVGLLSREYLALVALAAVVATPVAVVVVRRWLEEFAYHAPFSPLVLVAAALAALALAVASVGVQAFRAARRDPIRALRSE